LIDVFVAIERDAATCDAVLLTGDITDDGAAASWERFLKLCPPGLRGKVVLLPGNHDLNLQQGGVNQRGVLQQLCGWLSLVLYLRAERFDNFGRRMRQVRALCVMTELMGERAYLIDRRTNRLITLQDYFTTHQTAIEAHISGSEGPRAPMSQLWDNMFPLVVGAGNQRVGIILLDSVKRASINVTNAIGAMQTKAISACETLMAQTPDKFDCFVIALHHHIAIPSGSTWAARFKSAFLVFENATELVEMLTKRGEPSVVFHGHRHQEYLGTVQDTEVSVVATASATVGAHGRVGLGSWRIVKLAAAKDGCRLSSAPLHRNFEQLRRANDD
jgi:3',5'-cyclic AMP phosphodiesterase CpdA